MQRGPCVLCGAQRSTSWRKHNLVNGIICERRLRATSLFVPAPGAVAGEADLAFGSHRHSRLLALPRACPSAGNKCYCRTVRLVKQAAPAAPAHEQQQPELAPQQPQVPLAAGTASAQPAAPIPPAAATTAATSGSAAAGGGSLAELESLLGTFLQVGAARWVRRPSSTGCCVLHCACARLSTAGAGIQQAGAVALPYQNKYAAHAQQMLPAEAHRGHFTLGNNGPAGVSHAMCFCCRVEQAAAPWHRPRPPGASSRLQMPAG